MSYSNRRTAVAALGQGAFVNNIFPVYAFAVRTVHTFSAWFVDGAAAAVFALEIHDVISLCNGMKIAKVVARGTNWNRVSQSLKYYLNNNWIYLCKNYAANILIIIAHID